MDKHRCSFISVKSAEIDNEIIPLVQWLNSFDGIFTRWCCAGDAEDRSNFYVSFYCDNDSDLYQVLDKLQYLADITIDLVPERRAMIRYHLTLGKAFGENAFGELMSQVRDWLKERESQNSGT